MSDERRAEIEAVVRELKYNDECGPGPVSEAEYRADAEAIIAALDRLRDARGDDDGSHEGCERRGGVCDCAGRPCAVDYPDAARWERTAKVATAVLVKAEDRIAELEAARSPQGEDHEPCPSCNGKGRIDFNAGWHGPHGVERHHWHPCPDCDGSGKRSPKADENQEASQTNERRL